MTVYDDGEILCDCCDAPISFFYLESGAALSLDTDSQGVHVCRTCRRPELVTGVNARICGTPEHYNKNRTNCDCWEFDVDYYKSILETDPSTAKAYFNNCVESRMCELCIWNDGESCTFNEANPVTSESGTVAT